MPSHSTAVLIAHPDMVIAAGLTQILKRHQEFRVLPPAAASTAAVLITDLAGGLAALAARTAPAHGPGPGPGPAILVVADADTVWNVRTALNHGVDGYLLQSASLEQILAAAQCMAQRQRYIGTTLVSVLAPSASPELMTSRESDVLQLLARGQSNKLIANNLGIGLGTVKSHMKSVMAKLDALSRTHAVVLAAQRGLLHPRYAPPVAGRRPPFATPHQEST